VVEGSARGSCRLARYHCSMPEPEGCSPRLPVTFLHTIEGTLMRCAICSDQIDVSHPLVLPTTDGQYVHLICAEREARAAARRRSIRAIIITILLTGVFAAALLLGLGSHTLVILALLFIAVHVSVNRRWWHYTIQSARRWRLRR
jgi:hypothetical protein